MTLLNSQSRRYAARRRRSHAVPIAVGGAIAVAAITMVGYLLWPTFTQSAANNPERIPVSIGATVFNVPARAFRVKVQKHSGPQDRVDLSFDYPSLEAPDLPRHISADTVDDNPPVIDRIFVSISAHDGGLSPETRARTIYPRYLDAAGAAPQDGLTVRAFRDGTAYAGDDLFFANAPALVARCTRDGATPGMCLSERRIEGANLTFRFPRPWLSDWRKVADAMDRLTAQMRGAKGI